MIVITAYISLTARKIIRFCLADTIKEMQDYKDTIEVDPKVMTPGDHKNLSLNIHRLSSWALHIIDRILLAHDRCAGLVPRLAQIIYNIFEGRSTGLGMIGLRVCFARVLSFILLDPVLYHVTPLLGGYEGVRHMSIIITILNHFIIDAPFTDSHMLEFNKVIEKRRGIFAAYLNAILDTQIIDGTVAQVWCTYILMISLPRYYGVTTHFTMTLIN